MNESNTCSACGEYTHRTDCFSRLICADCHQREDDDIEQYERAQAKRFGYQYGWSEDR